MSVERKDLEVVLPRNPNGWCGAEFAGRVKLKRGSRQLVLDESEWHQLLALLLKLKGQRGVVLG